MSQTNTSKKIKGEEKPCGKCGSCVERAEGFVRAGMIDPTL